MGTNISKLCRAMAEQKALERNYEKKLAAKMTVKEIVAEFLHAHGFDGLCCADCGCGGPTLMDCGCVGEGECGAAKWVACGRCEKYDECGIKADFCEGEKRGCYQEVKNAD